MLEAGKSTHKAEVVPIELLPHFNADSLSIVKVYGYVVVVNTAAWQGVTKGIYITPDSLVDTTRPEFDFLATDSRADGKYRVRAKKIRQVVSYGMLVPAPANAVIGDDYAQQLGVERFDAEEEREKTASKNKLNIEGANESEPVFNTGPVKYDIDSFKRYAYVLMTDGEPVYISEKLDGSNVRYSYRDGRYYVKSRNNWLRRVPDYSKVTVDYLTAQGCSLDKANEVIARLNSKEQSVNPFWQRLERCEPLMKYLRDNEGMTVFGEMYGNTNILKYGLPEGNRFAAFDITDKNGQFVAAPEFASIVVEYSIPRAPLVAEAVPYSFDLVKQLATGKTAVSGSTVIREGVVVRPAVERYDYRFGRIILKCVSPDFLALKY